MNDRLFRKEQVNILASWSVRPGLPVQDPFTSLILCWLARDHQFICVKTRIKMCFYAIYAHTISAIIIIFVIKSYLRFCDTQVVNRRNSAPIGAPV